ncbi:MAG TPA: type II secretion system protein [Patescibacteria group bacterium]|nr:type II secretion system protein [Patescibacteria group bacterium]
MNFKLSTTARSMKSGFTLVELLIVIGLLGAIALIVISAINPIEQANKARDARFKADASQLISAIERYYASNSVFPWQNCGAGVCPTSSDQFGFISANDTSVGLCGTVACNDQTGVLIASDELKTEFLTRDWVKAGPTAVETQIQIGKGSGSSSSVYACFIPLAKATKDTALANHTVRAIGFTNGLPNSGTCANSTTDNWTTKGCYVCIPE